MAGDPGHGSLAFLHSSIFHFLSSLTYFDIEKKTSYSICLLCECFHHTPLINISLCLSLSLSLSLSLPLTICKDLK